MSALPLCIALALRQVEAMHAAVVTGIIPLGTAAVGALWLRQRPSAGLPGAAAAALPGAAVCRAGPASAPTP
jgi:drug/metabolite transporter (DMT)-like permease